MGNFFLIGQHWSSGSTEKYSKRCEKFHTPSRIFEYSFILYVSDEDHRLSVVCFVWCNHTSQLREWGRKCHDQYFIFL